MNILGRELGKKFEKLYTELDNSGKSMEFMPLSSLTVVSQQDLRGARHTDPQNPNKVVIYLDKKLSDEEFREFVRKSLTICEEVVESKKTYVWGDCDHCDGRGCHWCGYVGRLPTCSNTI